MSVFLKCVLECFSLFVLNTFCLLYANNGCKKGEEIIKDNLLLLKFGMSIFLFFKVTLFGKSASWDTRLIAPLMPFEPKEMFLNKPFIKIRVLFTKKMQMKFMYFLACLLYYAHWIILLLLIGGSFLPFIDMEKLDWWFKNAGYYQLSVWAFLALLILY